ncbi:MAG: hypothetical protein H6574_20705 [Lewinellaceae bacterium]|nr:hypothetical protein [Lewinellaceae bacterium]
MNTKRLYWWLIPLFGLGALTCTREYIDDLQGVCFERDVLPIFQSNCTQSGCHNSQDRESGYDLSSYNGIMAGGITPGNYKASKIYKVLVAPLGRMPQSPFSRLTDEQITTIAVWIEDGALNEVCPIDTSCNVTGVSFSGSVRPILQLYCNGCHSGSNPEGGINYSTYNGVKANVDNGSLLGSIQHLSAYVAMPKNANKLSPCNINIIKAWIDSGAPNN